MQIKTILKNPEDSYSQISAFIKTIENSIKSKDNQR